MRSVAIARSNWLRPVVVASRQDSDPPRGTAPTHRNAERRSRALGGLVTSGPAACEPFWISGVASRWGVPHSAASSATLAGNRLPR